jgi:hypothetical protein
MPMKKKEGCRFAEWINTAPTDAPPVMEFYCKALKQTLTAKRLQGICYACILFQPTVPAKKCGVAFSDEPLR